MAIIKNGIVKNVTNPGGMPYQDVIYTATDDIRITFMQFISDNIADIDLTVHLVLYTGEIIITPRLATITKTNILQFDVDYVLAEDEWIYVTCDTDNVVNYLINGEAV